MHDQSIKRGAGLAFCGQPAPPTSAHAHENWHAAGDVKIDASQVVFSLSPLSFSIFGSLTWKPRDLTSPGLKALFNICKNGY